MTPEIIIIGGGVAAFNAIKSIREIDSDVIVHLIQNEPIYPYYRTRLTKSLFEDLDPDRISLQKKEWYDKNNVNLHLGKEVIGIDTEKNTVSLDDGSCLKYSKLLLANGASNFKPNIEGVNKENVFTIRKFEDIQAIKSKSDDKQTILHIGGGIQNLEAAWAFCSHDKRVIIVEFMDRLMPRQLDTRASEILFKAVTSYNTKVLLSTEVISITGDDKVNAVTTRNRNSSESISAEQSIACDMVIYSVGIRPNIKICDNTSIQISKGVIVDDHMRTNLDNIYAAGDITEYDGRVGGLWPIAIEQGKTSGYNLVGKDVSYTGILPVTTMNAFNLNIFSIGTIDEGSATLTLIDDPGDNNSYKRIFFKNNTIIGAIVIGDTKHNNLLKKFVTDKSDISGLDLSNISVNELLEHLKAM
ncbi:MAG: FAD-dependent oxidoreductase [Herbinix sp.]|nr:FAD-dependent oxidoreductase [Herbinix sp.]